jgi:hypothetical protein
MFESSCQHDMKIIPGAERTDLYLNMLSDKNIAIVANQTSMIEDILS